LIGNYHFAHDYGCVHPGMPLGRKHLRRSRDAPNLGWTIQRATSRLGVASVEVKHGWLDNNRAAKFQLMVLGGKRSIRGHPLRLVVRADGFDMQCIIMQE